MKKAVWFLLGFTLSVAWGCQYVHATVYDCSAVQSEAISLFTAAIYPSYNHLNQGSYESETEAQQLIVDIRNNWSEYCSEGFYSTADSYTAYVSQGSAKIFYNRDGCNNIYFAVVCIPCTDMDGDGIDDEYDLKPNSSESYNAAIVSICYDQNNKVVAGIVEDDQGNRYFFGTMPTDLEGYTIDSIIDGITYQSAEDLAAKLQKLDIDDLNLTKKATSIEVEPDGTVPPSTDPFDDYEKAEDDQTKAKEPDTQAAPPSEQPDSNDFDSDRFDKIIKNTGSTNTNLENIQKYLGITNDSLAKINKNIKSGSGVDVTVTTPTADEIGQSVKDNLIDPGQTIDSTITDNIPDLDETDALTATQTKYSDRYDLFITTLKESDLFSLPFGIFTGPSGSGASIQTVNIGKWGSSSEQTATIDYSDYDNIWDILRAVLLLLTSFSCFKILVLKKG